MDCVVPGFNMIGSVSTCKFEVGGSRSGSRWSWVTRRSASDSLPVVIRCLLGPSTSKPQPEALNPTSSRHRIKNATVSSTRQGILQTSCTTMIQSVSTSPCRYCTVETPSSIACEALRVDAWLYLYELMRGAAKLWVDNNNNNASMGDGASSRCEAGWHK